MITATIKKKIQAIVSVFETSSTQPKYDIITCLHDGPRNIKQITYGKHQTTEYGKLRDLLKMYCDKGGRYAAELKNYLQFIGRHDHPLADNHQFKSLLKYAGTDIIMQQVQDEFFDRFYWNPALNFFSANLFNLPLSMAVIYDSYIHSGGIPKWLRDDFAEKTPLNGGDEKKWITAYVHARDYWLENHSNKILRNTDYRTDCWIAQIETVNWDLSEPVLVKFNSGNQKQWIRIN